MDPLTQLLRTINANPVLTVLFVIWLVAWKGYALWTAATKGQLSWFILLLIINTFGLLEIVYLLYLSKWDLGSKQLRGYLNKVKKKLRK